MALLKKGMPQKYSLASIDSGFPGYQLPQSDLFLPWDI